MYLDWQKTDAEFLAIDIEADSLTPAVIYCMTWENVKTKERGELVGHAAIRQFIESNYGSKWIGHNIVKYDVPALNRILGTRIALGDCIDSLILSTLYSPSLEGGHSLASWGMRLKMPKGDFDDFSKFSPEMLVYCAQDTAICAETFRRLTAAMIRVGISEKSCWIQHRIIHILERQRKNGFHFNEHKAIDLRNTLELRKNELEQSIIKRFPPVLEPIATYAKALKADGSYSAGYLRHSGQYPRVELLDDGRYTAFDYVSFNLGSPKQRVEKLLELGWKPEEFTKPSKSHPNGQPKPTEKGDLSPSLRKFADEAGIDEVAEIAKWMAFAARSSMIQTWLNEYNYDTQCIHGNIFVADTLRFRHQAPNTANIPAVRLDKDEHPILGEAGYYTFESRDCWEGRPGRTLVGTDAKALEYRMLAHWVGNQELIDVVLNSDVHSFTQEMAGLKTRANAKTLNFAIVYGSGDAKTGKIVGGNAKDGRALKEKLFANIPGLGDAISEAQREYRNGRIKLIDGSAIICPSEHAAFNYKLQGSGARLMAQGAIFLEGYIRSKGLSSLKVGDIHDEWQYDVSNEDAEEHARLATQALRDAGEELNLRIMTDGESKIGRTWACTH